MHSTERANRNPTSPAVVQGCYSDAGPDRHTIFTITTICYLKIQLVLHIILLFLYISDYQLNMFIVTTHALHCLYDIQVEFLANILYPAYITICAVSYDSPEQFVYSHANICNNTSNVHVLRATLTVFPD